MNKLTYIDDRQLDQFILKKILSRFGSSFEVKCTDTGNEVLNLLSKNRSDRNELPDIILLDIYMNGFDSWDFLDKLQLLNPLLAKPLKVYILSASQYPEDVERARRYACVKAFILKPITVGVLQKLMRQRGVPLRKLTTNTAQN
jgi:CheY-like chemotaxis protein